MNKEIKVCSKCQYCPKPHESLWMLNKIHEAGDTHTHTHTHTRKNRTLLPKIYHALNDYNPNESYKVKKKMLENIRKQIKAEN